MRATTRRLVAIGDQRELLRIRRTTLPSDGRRVSSNVFRRFPRKTAWQLVNGLVALQSEIANSNLKSNTFFPGEHLKIQVLHLQHSEDEPVHGSCAFRCARSLRKRQTDHGTGFQVGSLRFRARALVLFGHGCKAGLGGWGLSEMAPSNLPSPIETRSGDMKPPVL